MKMNQNKLTNSERLIRAVVFFSTLGCLFLIILYILFSSEPTTGCGSVTKTRGDCRDIAFAVEQYYQDYGQFPSTSSTLTPIDATLLSILNGNNPRQKQYYQNSGKMSNPFGYSYCIAVDTDFDDEINVSGNIDGVTYPLKGTEKIKSRVAVISLYDKKKKTFAKSWD